MSIRAGGTVTTMHCGVPAAEYHQRRREERARRLADPQVFASLQHGTRSTFVNWKCRCGPCRAADADYRAGRRPPTKER